MLTKKNRKHGKTTHWLFSIWKCGQSHKVKHTSQVNTKRTKSHQQNHVLACFNILFLLCCKHAQTVFLMDWPTAVYNVTGWQSCRLRQTKYIGLRPWLATEHWNKHIRRRVCARTHRLRMPSVICWCLLAVVRVPGGPIDWWGVLFGSVVVLLLWFQVVGG